MRVNNIFNWIKNHKILTILLIVLFLIINIIIVQIPYWIGNYFPLIYTKLMPGDILLYLGSFLAFIGTISLGFLVLHQNQQIYSKSEKQNTELRKINEQSNDINKRLLTLQESQYMPLLDVLQGKMQMIQFEKKRQISIEFSNIGKSIMKYCNYEIMSEEETRILEKPTVLKENWIIAFPKAVRNFLKYFTEGKEIHNKSFIGEAGDSILSRLGIGKKKTIKIRIPNDKKKVAIKIEIYNIYGTKYIEIIKFDVIDIVENHSEIEIKNVSISAEISNLIK